MTIITTGLPPHMQGSGELHSVTPSQFCPEQSAAAG